MDDILVLSKTLKYSTSPQYPWVIGISPFLHIEFDYNFMDRAELNDFLTSENLRVCKTVEQLIGVSRKMFTNDELYKGVTFVFAVEYAPVKLERKEYKETVTKFLFSVKEEGGYKDITSASSLPTVDIDIPMPKVKPPRER